MATLKSPCKLSMTGQTFTLIKRHGRWTAYGSPKRVWPKPSRVVPPLSPWRSIRQIFFVAIGKSGLRPSPSHSVHTNHYAFSSLQRRSRAGRLMESSRTNTISQDGHWSNPHDDGRSALPFRPMLKASSLKRDSSDGWRA